MKKVLIGLLFIWACGAPQQKPQPVMALTLPAATSPNLVYQETFEGSAYFPVKGTTINLTHGIENCNNDGVDINGPQPWTLSRSPIAFQGIYSSRFEIRKDQPLVGSSKKIRSEVTVIKADDPTYPGPDIWYSYAIMFPSTGFEYDDTRDCIDQWYEDGSNETTLRCAKDRAFLEVAIGTTKTYDLFGKAIPKDEWHEFVYHFVHSKGADGLIEIWRDGTKIWTINGPNIHLMYPKWKIGLYKASFLDGSSKQYSRVLYFDNVRVGNKNATQADMISGTGSTDTVPPPPPPPANKIPVAKAGNDVIITLPTNSTSLSGSATDSDGAIVKVQWTKASGADGIVISGPNTLTPTISNLLQGIYTFRLTVTDDKGATASDDLNITVNAAPPPPPPPPPGGATVNSFTLINSGTEKDIQIITDGQIISIAATKATKFNIRANTNNTTSVKFELSGKQTRSYTDDKTPFALMGDNGKGNYYYGNWNPPAPGSYTLRATPYSGTLAGASYIITFTFVK